MFERDDVEKIANHIGDHWGVSLLDGNKIALIKFSSFVEAFRCFELLDGKTVSGHNSKDNIEVSFIEANQRGRGMIDLSQQNIPAPENEGDPEDPVGNKTMDTNFSNKKQPSSSSNLPKITCKYEIDYFNEEASKDFLFSKRIIGPKGSNMKKIIEECFNDRPFEGDALKLRLRGRGSGFKEGPQNRGMLTVTCRMQRAASPLHKCQESVIL